MQLEIDIILATENVPAYEKVYCTVNFTYYKSYKKSFYLKLQKNRCSKRARQEAKEIAAAAPSQEDSPIKKVDEGDQVDLNQKKLHKKCSMAPAQRGIFIRSAFWP